MKDVSYVFYMVWLKVPDFSYFILLFGGWIVLIISVGFIIRGFVRKKEKRYFIKCAIMTLVALVISVLTMTGKIAPHMAFGG